MYSQWQPTPSHLNQPIQLWQLEDAHHAARLAEKRLAEAEHAYARETEQLHTTIAAYEHSAAVRETNIRDLGHQVKLLKQERVDARVQYEKAITTAEKRVSEMSAEYAAETRRMREVVSDHQRTAAERESDRTDLANKLVGSEATIQQLQQQASDLTDRLDEKSRVLADVDVSAKDKLAVAEKLGNEQQAEIQRLRVQLDETETQHRGDVESMRQNIDDLRVITPEQAQTVQDLSQLCDQNAAELAEALELAAFVEAELGDSKLNHLAEIELYQEEVKSKDETITEQQVALTQQQSEVVRLAAELKAKQAELDDVAQMSDSIDLQLNEAVDAHSEQLAHFEAAMVEKEQHVSARKTELRSLAQRTYRRETQFKQIVTDLRSEASQTLQETIAGYEAEAEQLREVITTLEQTGIDREQLIHELKREVEQLQAEQRDLSSQYSRESAELQQNSAASINQVRSELMIQIHQLQAEVQITASQLQTTQDELSRTRTALQTTAQDHSINSVQATELAAKATELQNQLASLQQQHELASQESQRSIADQLVRIETANQQSASLTQQLSQSSSENQQLADHFKVARANAAKYKQRTDRLSKKLREVIAVHRRLKSHPETLKRFRSHVEELNRRIDHQAQAGQKANFTVTQLNRTVAWLEHTSESLQGSLQREAAARRKAESVLKQMTEDEQNPATVPTVAQSAAQQIEADEKINRLVRELEATRKMRLIERKQAKAEFKRLNDELSAAKTPVTVRRAA